MTRRENNTGSKVKVKRASWMTIGGTEVCRSLRKHRIAESAEEVMATVVIVKTAFVGLSNSPTF